MNRPIKNALLTLIMVILMATAAHAIYLPPSHSFGTPLKCGVCHASAYATTAAKNNVCLVCHKAGSQYATNKQFFIGDMANPFQTTIESHAKDSYTHSSHEWSATDNNPAAGALPPVTPIMFSIATYAGSLSCNRCHSIHLQSNIPKLLRQPVANDELCLDCHRLRNTASHTKGTHPININYTSIAKNKPTAFSPVPTNSNPANPTSAMKLANGKIVCTTCHSTHYSDSSSKTLDNFSTAMVNGLLPSRGYLLKTDYRYVNYTAIDSPNICTNCHINRHEHNGGGQRVRCTDCHGGHVDYDANATDAKSMVPNVYMIKRYMNWSSASGWKNNFASRKQTFFRYSSDSNLYYKNSTGTGVCESCHAVPPAGSANGREYPGEHSLNDAKASDCNGCHNHAGPVSFGSDCTTCHGQPPVSLATSAPGYTGTEELSAHAKHAGRTTGNYSYGCVECHYSGAPSALHNKGSFQDVYAPGYTGILAHKGGSTPGYNPADNTCSSVYCHSNGDTVAPAYKQSPAWFSGSTTCDSCHDASPTTKAHSVHMANNYTCENCHAATASGSSAVINPAKHTDGNKDILFSSGSLNFPLSGTSCSTVYCHSNGGNPIVYSSPDWSNPATGACGTCHATSDNATHAHQAHLSTSVQYAYGARLNQFNDVVLACNSCHGPDYSASHVNGATEVEQSSCAMVCHANGLGSASWATGRAGVTCESCHTGTLSRVNGVTAPDKSLAASKGHNMNSSSTGVIMNYSCTACHDPNAAHINANPAVHDNRLVANLVGALNVQCNYCHNDASKVLTVSKRSMPTHVTDLGNATVNNFPSSCSTCHDLHGTANRNMIRASINGQNIVYTSSTSMINTTPVGGVYVGLCQICHTKTKYYTNSALLAGHHTSNCLNCHKHKGEVFAFKGVGGTCDSCHGYPPVQTMTAGMGTLINYSGAKLQNYSGGGGAHSVEGHVPKATRPAVGWANCANCHYGSDTDGTHMKTDYRLPGNINVKVDPKFKFDSKLPITYSGNLSNNPSTYSSGKCSNVSCHFQITPKWSTQK